MELGSQQNATARTTQRANICVGTRTHPPSSNNALAIHQSQKPACTRTLRSNKAFRTQQRLSRSSGWGRCSPWPLIAPGRSAHPWTGTAGGSPLQAEGRGRASLSFKAEYSSAQAVSVNALSSSRPYAATTIPAQPPALIWPRGCYRRNSHAASPHRLSPQIQPITAVTSPNQAANPPTPRLTRDVVVARRLQLRHHAAASPARRRLALRDGVVGRRDARRRRRALLLVVVVNGGAVLRVPSGGLQS